MRINDQDDAGRCTICAAIVLDVDMAQHRDWHDALDRYIASPARQYHEARGSA